MGKGGDDSESDKDVQETDEPKNLKERIEELGEQIASKSEELKQLKRAMDTLSRKDKK